MAQATSYATIRTATRSMVEKLVESFEQVVGDKKSTIDALNGMIADEFAASGTTNIASDATKSRTAHDKLANELVESLEQVVGDKRVAAEIRTLVAGSASITNVATTRTAIRELANELVESLEQVVGDKKSTVEIRRLIGDELRA